MNQLTQDILNEDIANNLYLLQTKESVEQVECGSLHTVVRTNMNRLFSCGNGSTYALGHGNKETCKGFKQIQFFNGEQGEGAQVTGVGITTIACGLMHSGCVLSDGSVYQWGTCGDYAKLKELKNSRELLLKCICQFPTKVSFRKYKELTNATGQGSANLQARRKSGQDVEGDQTGDPVIADLRMGEQFTIALSKRGYVYTWGMNEKGQLGIGNESPAYDPVQIPQIGPSAKHTIKPITKIACGLKHCLVLSNKYKLYAWGSNLQCQLGKRLLHNPQAAPANMGGSAATSSGGVLSLSNVPVQITSYDQATPIQIACGSYHNIILSRSLPKQEQPSLEN
jgi:mitogen-activated protein kinase kinase kinase 9